jgi:hypothetical protein
VSFFESIERRQNVLEHRSELSRLAVNASLPRDRVSGWLIAMLCTIAAVNGFVFVQDVVNGASLYFAFYAELGKGSARSHRRAARAEGQQARALSYAD